MPNDGGKNTQGFVCIFSEGFLVGGVTEAVVSD